MLKILPASGADQLSDCLGADLYARLHASRHLCVPLDRTSYFLLFHYCHIGNPMGKDERVCIYCSREQLILVSDNTRCVKIMQGLDEDTEPFRMLLDFFLQLTSGDLDILEKLEDRITGLEDNIIAVAKPVESSEARIIAIRRSLLNMKRYYEQLSIVTSELAENVNATFSPELRKRFASLDRRVDHLLNFVLHLREYITQVREAYQAKIDIEQNQIMKVFTVLTAIFLPLTLIVGWYGMNFPMPEYGWNFGYYYVIILSAAVCLIGFILFRRKKWF